MGTLKVFKKDSIENQFEIASIKEAQKLVNKKEFQPVLKFVYSTTNKAGIENTINILKR